MMKGILEEIALIEMEAFCEEEGEAKNSFYERDVEGLFGRIGELRVPRTREGSFKPYKTLPEDIKGTFLRSKRSFCPSGGQSMKPGSFALHKILDTMNLHT